MEDLQAWQKYSHMRNWFNKLYVASALEYNCGPGGVPPTISDYYCVRPTYNIGGMSVGARKQWIEAGDFLNVEPGYFWCEWFEGEQYSTTYKRNDNFEYKQVSCYKAHRSKELYKFKKWTRSQLKIKIHPIIEDLLIPSMVEVCNIETIGDKVIEIHFRDTPDPDYEEIIPIWSDEQHLVDNYINMGYSFIEGYDDSNGYLKNYRVGFMVK